MIFVNCQCLFGYLNIPLNCAVMPLMGMPCSHVIAIHMAGKILYILCKHKFFGAGASPVFHDIVAWQVLYVAHTGDSGAVMACTSFDVHFPLRLTSDHKPNRPDEHARIQDAGGNIDERRDRVVSDPKPHNNRVTLLNMSR